MGRGGAGFHEGLAGTRGGTGQAVRGGLRDLGHDVVVAGDGRHGLAEAVHGDYDVVLMEIPLPVFSGYEVPR